MKTITNRRSGRAIGVRAQKGFGMAIALAVLAVFALIAGAIALANKGGSSKTDLETSKVMATSIIHRGNEIYSATNRVAQDRDVTKMLLNATPPDATTGAFGLYSPFLNVANEVKIPAKAFTVQAEAALGLSSTIFATKIAVTVPGLSSAVCKSINNTIYGSAIGLDANIPADAAALLVLVPSATEGCVVAGTSANAYFKVVG